MKIVLTFLVLLISINVRSQALATVQAIVTTFSGEPILGKQIIFQSGTQSITAVSDSAGRFTVQLPSANKFDIKIKSVGETKDYSQVVVPNLQPGFEYGAMRLTIQIEKPRVFVLRNVYFETGKSSITSASYKELDELVEYLMNKPFLKIEIGGHTDRTGNEEENKKLSLARANSVKSYLVSQGVSADRTKTKGYGSSIPVSNNGTAQGRALNRRTEVVILE